MGQKLLSNAQTLPRYRLFDCGEYPGLVETESGISIKGEVWEVSTRGIARVDEIEGVAEKLFERRRIWLDEPYMDDYVEAYFYCRDIERLSDCGSCWPPTDDPSRWGDFDQTSPDDFEPF